MDSSDHQDHQAMRRMISIGNGKSPCCKCLKQGLPVLFQLTIAIATILGCSICLLIGLPGVMSSSSNRNSQFLPPAKKLIVQLNPLQNSPKPAINRARTTTANIAFGIGAASYVLGRRKEYIRSWWKPGETRGFVFVDQPVSNWSSESLPELKISENTTRFSYTCANGKRSAIRISRIVSELFRMGLHDVHWFVLGDDDTVFFVQNLVKILSKYDHNRFFYIGSSSENHLQNVRGFSSNMAYGGGGFAISVALATALSKMQDDCLQRYHFLYGSDDRIHACMAELAVQLTREPGFHQFDIQGDASGILAAHPVAPAVSLHHLNVIQPLFPVKNQQESIKHLASAANVDPAGILQQSICYDMLRNVTVQISWGYLIQVSRALIPPRILELPLRTFAGWYGERSELSFPFKTRAMPANPCERPIRFYMEAVNRSSEESGSSMTSYSRLWVNDGCSISDWGSKLSRISVEKRSTDESWYQVPRRQCCSILNRGAIDLALRVSDCRDDQYTSIGA